MSRLKIYKELINKWIEDEKRVTCGKDVSRKYKESSMKRFRYLVNLCKFLNPDRSIDILDVGRSYLSFLFSEYYSHLTTLGLDLSNEDEDRELEKKNVNHIIFDLNNAKDTSLWPADKKYDLIVCSEVIEHLHEAPEYSLLFLKYFLKRGGLLICSTPNAVAVHKRLNMISGRNPFEKIRFYSKNPGHFREYTKIELMDMGEKCGLDLISHKYINFFAYPPVNFYRKVLEKIYIIVAYFVPSWKNLQIVVFKKPIS